MSTMESLERVSQSIPYSDAMAEAAKHVRPLHPEEGVFISEAERQKTALNSLPDYDVKVMERYMLSEASATRSGMFIEEKVLFSDGAIRTMTLGVPDEKYLGKDNISPYPVSGTDAWLTGPHGINKIIIRDLVESGYPVMWLHHQGRHSERPTTIPKAMRLARFIFNKNLGRSAHHQHALFNDLAPHAPFDSETIFSTGDSRGAMTGEAVDALAPLYDRKVGYSDYIATCFQHRPSRKELRGLLKAPINEARALGDVALRLIRDDIKNGRLSRAASHLGTFDPHPMNMLHELAWMPPLINGDAGKYAEAVPLDSKGVRTLLSEDLMSQHKSWQAAHASRPGIHFFVHEGRHLNLANPEIQQARIERFKRLLQEMHRNEFSLTGVDFSYVRQPQPRQEAA